jgi:hypothetical protein
MAGDTMTIKMEEGEGSKRSDSRKKQKGHETTLPADGASAEDRKDWAMEVYQGNRAKEEGEDDEEGMLELDLDEEEAELSTKHMAIAVFYSRKTYNPQYLFSDMMAAWGVPKMTAVEKIGDYTFKLEFVKEEEKIKVLEGGPWRHKGDALIVVHYDGLAHPFEVCIEVVGLWVRFYDLPPAMMKEVYAKQLGGQLGNFVKMDARYPGYLHVRVGYSLTKPLVPCLRAKVKGPYLMAITLRYENVPHFCFTYGRLGMQH